MSYNNFVEEKKCGNCNCFDTNNAEGKPFGSIIKDEKIEIKKGVCRTNMGLVLGELNETLECKKPESFTPREFSLDN